MTSAPASAVTTHSVNPGSHPPCGKPLHPLLDAPHGALIKAGFGQSKTGADLCSAVSDLPAGAANARPTENRATAPVECR